MMFFSGWSSLGRILIVGVLAYVSLVVLLRISGKRTLSKMNAFDFVVTVALGSTLATILLSKETSLADGVTALGLLIALQYVVAWTTYRSRNVEQIVKSEPALLFHRGEFLDQALKRERVVRGEVYAAIRNQGVSTLEEVSAVVLETDGTFSVLRTSQESGPSTLAGMEGNSKPA